MSEFDMLGKKSNELAVKYLKKYFKNEESLIIKEEEDRYSRNDIMVYLKDGKTIMIEVKVRNRFYNSLVLEDHKLFDLLEKGKKLEVDEIWYMNIFDECESDYRVAIYNITNLLDKDIMDCSNIVLFSGQLEDDEYKNRIVHCKYILPKSTAGSKEKIVKPVHIIPIRYAFGFKKQIKEYDF
jgi:hypothetical protein